MANQLFYYCDEDNVKDLSTGGVGELLQEIGYGESKKLRPNFFFVRKEPCAITYQRFYQTYGIERKLAIWSVQTGVTRTRFFKGNTE